MDVRDCIRYKNALKLVTHLRSSSKSVTAWFTTWNPSNWHQNQLEIRSKTLLILKHCAHANKPVGWCQLSVYSKLYFDHRSPTYARATLCRTIRWYIKLWDITSLGSVQVVGFFDVAARLSTGAGPIAELVGTTRSFLCCDERIKVTCTFSSSVLSDYVHMKARCVFIVLVLCVRNCLVQHFC